VGVTHFWALMARRAYVSAAGHSNPLAGFLRCFLRSGCFKFEIGDWLLLGHSGHSDL